METEKIIESILFWKGEPVSRKELIRIINVSEDEFAQAIENLKKSLFSRGIKLLDNQEELTLVTCPEASQLLSQLEKEEMEKELSKAALETLAIILYKAPISKSYIDYIRGVNSQFILRSLLIRGLVERKNSETGEDRGFVYYPSLDLLRYLGVDEQNKLPDFEQIKDKLEKIEKENTEEKNG